MLHPFPYSGALHVFWPEVRCALIRRPIRLEATLQLPQGAPTLVRASTKAQVLLRTPTVQVCSCPLPAQSAHTCRASEVMAKAVTNAWTVPLRFAWGSCGRTEVPSTCISLCKPKSVRQAQRLLAQLSFWRKRKGVTRKLITICRSCVQRVSGVQPSWASLSSQTLCPPTA